MLTPRENVLQAFKHKETVWTPNAFTDLDRVLQSTVMERYEGKETGFDEFGVQYNYVPEADSPMVRPGTFKLTDITKWKEQIVFPDVDMYDWEAGAARDTAGWDRKNKFSVVMLYNGSFERLHALMGFEDALIALMDEPEATSDFFSAFVDYRIKLFKKIAHYYKPDSVMVFDDYGTDCSMMMSPNVWREVIKPHVCRAIDAVHECGMYYILHSCGYIKPIFPDFVEMGADCVHPLQFANDVGELKRKFGKQITFTGGFNNTGIFDSPTVTEEEIRSEVRRVLEDVAPGGSYIAWQTILDKNSQKIFLDEIMKDSAPKMLAAGVTLPDLAKLFT